jgi:hypothetical protein
MFQPVHHTDSFIHSLFHFFVFSFIHSLFLLFTCLSFFFSFIQSFIQSSCLFVHSFFLSSFISFIHSFTNLTSFHVTLSQTQVSSCRIARHNWQAVCQISKPFSVCGTECLLLKVWCYVVIVNDWQTDWLTERLTDYQTNITNYL